MSWVRLDDAAPDHPKLIGLDDAAFRLWVTGLCYCGRTGTDGRIPAAALPRLTRARRPADVAARLVAAHLWCTTDDGGYAVHDYLVYQPSAEQTRERRAEISVKRAEAGRRGAEKRWQTDGKRMANANGKAMAPSHPIPADPSSHGQATDVDGLRDMDPAALLALVARMAGDGIGVAKSVQRLLARQEQPTKGQWVALAKCLPREEPAPQAEGSTLPAHLRGRTMQVPIATPPAPPPAAAPAPRPLPADMPMPIARRPRPSLAAKETA